MSTRLWETLSERSKLHDAVDFERAAYRLITSQVLTASEQTTRKDYHLVADHLGEFQRVLEPFAVELRHNAQFQYVVAKPRHVLRQRMASKAETLLVLVMADCYHRVRFEGQEDDFGQATIELPEFSEAYQQLTGLPFPSGVDLRHALSTVERWGIARREETPGDVNPFRLVISPVIADLVTTSWLNELAQLASPGEDEDPDADLDEEANDVSA